MIVALLLAGCGGAPEPGALDGTWVAQVMDDPAAFGAVVDAGGARAAWAALHAHAWAQVSGDDGVPARRAAAAWSAFDGVLAEVQEGAVLTLAEGWARRSPDVPMPGWLPASALRIARLRGDAAAEAAWAPRAPAGASPFAVDRPRPDRTAGRISDPTLGTFWDPTLPRALRTAPAAVPDDLAGRLFGPLPGFGTAPAADDADACRAVAVAFDARVDAGAAALRARAPAEGVALDAELRLIDVARARTLEAQAVAALDAGHPACALVYAGRAQDLAAPRAITPVNGPTLYAAMAAADLRLGHVREALDALAPLRPEAGRGYAEAAGAFEAVADLAAQQGLSGIGVSREN